MRTLSVFFAICLLLEGSCDNNAWALTLADINGRQLSVKSLRIIGTNHFSSREIRRELITKTRPWWLPWRAHPAFDTVSFASDLERISRFYEAHGYYDTHLTYELELTGENIVAATIQIQEGTPITVAKIKIDLTDTEFLPDQLAMGTLIPLAVDDIFTENAYQQGETNIRNHFLRGGYGKVHIKRKAQIDLDQQSVDVEYWVHSGPPTVFGQTNISGANTVDSYLILREQPYQAGDTFSLERVQEFQEKIFNLKLFSSVRLSPEETTADRKDIPVHVEVEEQRPRSLKLGLGYGTEDEFRGQVEWSNYNWFGDGRQLSLGLKLSAISRTLDASFIQPHFFSPNTRAMIGVKQEQQNEDTFLLNITRLRPRIEHNFSPEFSGSLGYRLEWLDISDVERATALALGGFRERGFLFGPTLGLIWNTAGDLFDPQGGHIVSLVAAQAGAFWGGDFDFYKVTVEAKKYQYIGWGTVLAGRLKIGLADGYDNDDAFPLFERFYAGGESGVRGYGRRRLGPLSTANDPIGGLSLLEGSLELRKPLLENLGAVAFVDFGQVSLKSYDLPIDKLRFSLGAGISYTSAAGPLRLDIGFPLDPPEHDQAWQIHFSIGHYF